MRIYVLANLGYDETLGKLWLTRHNPANDWQLNSVQFQFSGVHRQLVPKQQLQQSVDQC
jgi:hypothetical protein